jgi:hypothetical protein
VDVPQQIVQSILINSVLTIVDIFVVGLVIVIAAKSSCAMAPLKHVKTVKVHTTYFLPVEASTKA